MKLFALITIASVAITTVFAAGFGMGFPQHGAPGHESPVLLYDGTYMLRISPDAVTSRIYGDRLQELLRDAYRLQNHRVNPVGGSALTAPQIQGVFNSNRAMHRFIYLGLGTPGRGLVLAARLSHDTPPDRGYVFGLLTVRDMGSQAPHMVLHGYAEVSKGEEVLHAMQHARYNPAAHLLTPGHSLNIDQVFAELEVLPHGRRR
ncbi:uncharacterized protein SPSC_00074 [Sporisorium scitamineum]|uniref:Uncharacterized protein n=1 Tax=Sporisorium scitamineum TaxID=49012 RepID=A0A0F7RVU6_9BASI|nr:hypothetical protein [Sporisorium scitamineum]CDS81888.1 uncharacterized protein SPSC_00074 [Sporisorium scitamineum]